MQKQNPHENLSPENLRTQHHEREIRIHVSAFKTLYF